ncbi:MAG: hypothetical protein CMJ58_00805 [Planctomycetaceae bacterium]|nr:hypothetical protein [Planctomycetaceae bacterium]
MDTAANPTRPTEMPTALHKQGGWGRSAAQPPGPPLGAPAGRPQPPRGNARRRGFTLTELLVVIAIIAVLAALVTVAASRAISKAGQTRISLEISELSRTLEDFKGKYLAYPPNGMNDHGVSASNQSLDNIVSSDIERMFKKAFPRNKEPRDLILALAGVGPSGTNLENGMRAGEALYFWLGGFSDDPEYPISGQGGPSFDVSTGEVLEDRNRQQGYEFDLTRLVPRTDAGIFDENKGRFITYQDPRTGNPRRINFWQYVPSGFEQPFVYFDTSRHKPADYEMPAAPGVNNGPQIYALTKLREGLGGVSAINTPFTDIIYANNAKYQILHPGIDDAWGEYSRNVSLAQYLSDASQYLPYPSGPFTGEMADNLANFVSGTLADAQEE